MQKYLKRIKILIFTFESSIKLIKKHSNMKFTYLSISFLLVPAIINGEITVKEYVHFA